MRRMHLSLLVAALVTASSAAVAIAGSSYGHGDDERGSASAHATLIDPEGNQVGQVAFKQLSANGPVAVKARADGLTPGFHGFHVHAVGKCEPPTFTSAGPHLGAPELVHDDHLGDLPVLLVREDGSAYGEAVTDRFTIADLRDADGSAVMIHANADNYANIPDRYRSSASDRPGPDAQTLEGGDSGGRIACGEVG